MIAHMQLDGWSTESLSRMTERASGENPTLRPNEPFRYIDVSSVSNQSLRVESTTTLLGRDAPSRARKVVRAGDTIYATVRPMLRRVAYIDESLDGCVCSTGFCVLRPRRECVHPRYLYYLLLYDGVHQSIAAQQRGSSYPAVSDRVVFESEAMIPPHSEQRGIVAALGKIQAAVAAQQTVIDRTTELKSALMAKLFTEGTRGGTLKESRFGRVPSSWSIESLDDCAVVQTGVAKGRKLAGNNIVEVPYLRVANVQDGHLDLSEVKSIRLRESELSRYRLCAGDVVLTEGGDFDKLGRGFVWNGQIEPCVHQNHVFAVRVDRSRIEPSFFAYLCQSQYGKAYFLTVAHKTTNLACINTAKLRSLPVLVPTLDEQREIVELLDCIQANLAIARHRRDHFSELFSAMLDELMTGRIRVGDLDLADLERTN
jgi:type I restriction enzyme, S subunit